MKSGTAVALMLLSTSFLSVSAGRLLASRGRAEEGSFPCFEQGWRALFSVRGALYVLGQGLTVFGLALGAVGALLLFA